VDLVGTSLSRAFIFVFACIVFQTIEESADVTTDTAPGKNPVKMSFSMSAISQLKPNDAPSIFKKLMRKFTPAVISLIHRDTVPLKPEIEALPIHEFISRGWDARLNEWRKVVYPSLTSTFHRLSKSSEVAVWHLTVGDLTATDLAEPKSKEKERNSGESHI
jgi:hypothetical protein